MTTGSVRPAGQGFVLQAAGTLAVGAVSALAWFGWMGWDNEYSADGSGPYEAWQVLGCAGTLFVLLAGAVLVGVQPMLAAAALTLAFTVAWSFTAVASDDTTGMWGVGAFMVFWGLAVSSTVVAVVCWLLRKRLGRVRARGI